MPWNLTSEYNYIAIYTNKYIIDMYSFLMYAHVIVFLIRTYHVAVPFSAYLRNIPILTN